MEHLQSPFAIPLEDVDMLNRSEGFTMLRNYLARNADFCEEHIQCDEQAQETWLLHRDILHALIMPVVTLFERASALAEAALCTRKTEDLELAFAGEARGAFLCLQCFLTEEEEWCKGSGCPACVVNAALSTESHIRLTIAASLLSTAAIASPTSPAAVDDESNKSLPPLPHILPALRSALASDPFWNNNGDMWPYLLSRATQLSAGIQALITECVNLESLVSSPTSARPVQRRVLTYPHMPFSGATHVEGKGVKLRKSKLAKRQLRLKDEEVELMRRVALQCWAKARVPKQLRGEILGTGKVSRVRSLTCP
ncbi:hypothetical protein HBI23_047940 [Parastagonospora nodorum]|nr:hypothetical protein HBI12_030760 [Parastagonospora nodorum]KAH5454367.1 hypothetical protein HBI47_013520 [Parastagonospora nodorum]KAH5685743.1 hypothetical protein HBI23_047940 [Parastagonospora nodorum]